MLMIKKKSHVKKTHFGEVGTRSSLMPFQLKTFSDSMKTSVISCGGCLDICCLIELLEGSE